MKKLLVILALLVFVSPLAPAPEARAEERGTDLFGKDAPIEINADSISFDKNSGTYRASGNVVIIQNETTLSADSAVINMDSGKATASGNVVVVDEGGSTIKGANLRMNTEKKTLVLEHARIYYKDDNIYITGVEIRKTGPESYTALGSTYTACDCAEDVEPAWSFRASTARVKVGEYMTARGTTFRIKGVPVVYSPYMRVPIKRGRQTGFLTPVPGYSKLRGAVLKNEFFWAISKSTDATFYLDVETTRGLGKGVEYRYIRTRKSRGEFNAYHYGENDLDRVREFRSGLNNLSRPSTANDDRWRFNFVHNEELPMGLTMRADIDVVSDDEYFIDFGRSVDERSLESLESNISLTKNWSAYSLAAEFRYFDNLLLSDDSLTVQRMPEVSLVGSERRLGATPFYLSSKSSFVRFTRPEGTEGQRVDVRPRVSIPMSPGGYFELTPSAAPRGTFYYIKNSPGDRYSDRYLYDLSVDMTTTFVRVYRPSRGRMEAVRHTIRPRLVYTYIPEAVQTNLPKFDSVDDIAARNTLTYSMNMTLTGKQTARGAATYLEHMYLDISQSYNINDATRDLAPGEKRRAYSDIKSELKIKPNTWSGIEGRGAYDIYERRFNSYDASLSLSDLRGDKLDAAYRFTRAVATYLDITARGRIIRPVDVTYRKRFSFDEDRSLETSYGIEYTHQCWSAALSYTERLQEKLFFLVFDLKGIGKVANISGKVESR